MKNDKNKANSLLYDISLRISSLRKNKNLTQQRLGQLVGVEHTTISAYENDTSFPSLEVLIRLASVLDVSTDELLGITTNNKEKNTINPKNETINVQGLSKERIDILQALINDWKKS
ncbi:MAG: helix-turn-helix domain-containing protein [Lachnospirales bacterium]